jgi:hypothetical protein
MKEKHKDCIKKGKARIYLHHKDLIECLDKEPCLNRTPFGHLKFCKNRGDEMELEKDNNT